MTLTQVWGALIVLFVCPLLGGLPLIEWVCYAFTGKRLSKIGTGNISVSAAFQQAGKIPGILAVLIEAGKGIGSVLLARYFFPQQPEWEIIALIALVMGRYWLAKGAGVTNVVWGVIVHDPPGAVLIAILGIFCLIASSSRQSAKFLGLVILALVLVLRHIDSTLYVLAVIALAALIAWIYTVIPDDLAEEANSQPGLRFWQGAKVISLDDKLDSKKVGGKAANLSRLKAHGYNVPPGWILLPGENPASLIKQLNPQPEQPLIVRSSAIGEDGLTASAAGQYLSIGNITNKQELAKAIADCQASYYQSHSQDYRQQTKQADQAMAILIQKQIKGIFSGVAFSRNPINQLDDCVLIEALAGGADRVVSGKLTPEQYQAYVEDGLKSVRLQGEQLKQLEPSLQQVLKSIAIIAREIEQLNHGIPQDIEWTYDGVTIWLLQARPISTMQPIWTRKIAAEVIPGIILPLTWSINRPLTCEVWGKIFKLVLGKKAQDLDFQATATLHYSRAYFNATLLGEIFRRMGLPPESLEFLTRGAKMTKPPLLSTLKNLPGLLKLAREELLLVKNFQHDQAKLFNPFLQQLEKQNLQNLSNKQLLENVETILSTLQQATYYNILAPLSFSLRQAIIKTDNLDHSVTPELKSVQALAEIAHNTRQLINIDSLQNKSVTGIFTYLAESPEGEHILTRFNHWLQEYGYLSQANTDIAIPRWRENPQPVQQMFVQMLLNPDTTAKDNSKTNLSPHKSLQKRLQLKAKVAEVYAKLLAYLRWNLLEIASNLANNSILSSAESIFFLELSEIRRLIRDPNWQLPEDIISMRENIIKQHQNLRSVPYIVYGFPNQVINNQPIDLINKQKDKLQFHGIGASPGKVRGKVKIIHSLQTREQIDKDTILVLPYTDAGWSPLLARAGGIISEVGGRLSHGAIVAREYKIPAVMDIAHATELLIDGQIVEIDGQQGIVKIVENSTNTSEK